MPTYVFKCKCENVFDVFCSMSEIDDLKPQCPSCMNEETEREYSSQNVYGFDSSPKTLGMLAQKNADKYSNDYKENLRRKHNEYREKAPGVELPSGMSYGVELDKKQRKKDPKQYNRKKRGK